MRSVSEISASNNSVSIQTGKVSCYYGPLVTDPITQDWCFIVTKRTANGEKEVFRVTNEVLLEYSFGESPKDMLIAGLSLYLAK